MKAAGNVDTTNNQHIASFPEARFPMALEPSMRCVQVVPAISEEASGPSYSVVTLAAALKATGCQVEVCAMDWNLDSFDRGSHRLFKMAPLPKKLGSSPGMVRWLREQAQSGSLDLIHNHGMWQMNALYPSRAVRGTSTKLVSSPRGALSEWALGNGSRFKPLFWKLLQKPALLQVDCFHATAYSEYEDIRRCGFAQPVALIPNGVESLGETSDKEREKTVLFLGRVHPKKGIENLLEAWSKLEPRYADWSLRIVGPMAGYDGKSAYFESLLQLVEMMHLRRVEFTGPKYGEEKCDEYAKASVFVLPTHSENFGMTVAEALASGTPAIVTKGAPWQGLEEKNAGWWVDRGATALASSLAEAMNLSPEELGEMGRCGRDWMEEDFSWGRIGQQMHELYEWLCHGGEIPEHVVTG